MSNVTTYPSIQLQGINDKSARTIPLEPTLLSQHTPLFAILAKMGRPGVNVIASNNFTSLYGTDTLEPTSDYYTHQSEAVTTCIGAGNGTIAVNRIIPSRARTATVSLGVDSLLPNDWFMADIETAKTSPTYVPVLEAHMDNEGAWGNSYGFTISKSGDMDRRLAGITDEVEVYRFQLLQVDDYTGETTPVPNLLGEYTTLFTFKPETNGRGDINYFLNDRIRQCFHQTDQTITKTPLIKSLRFYIENFASLATKSPNYDPLKELWNQDMDAIFDNTLVMFNLFSGDHHFQFSGGSDGLESDLTSYITKRLERVRIYDDGVKEFFNSLTEDNFYTDPAKYPYSTIWDTGFSYDTKLAMRTVMDTRRDVAVVLSCFTVADYMTVDDERIFAYVPPQTEEQIQGFAARLQAAFRLYPESWKYGTAALRSTIVKNSGVINNSPYKKRRSVAIALIEKVSKHMGAGTGKWREEYAIDTEANRILAGWGSLDVGYQRPNLKLLNSENGLTIVDTLDTHRHYFPYYQTIYNDPTSVLNDFVTMMACCWLEKLGMEAWRRFGGDMSVGRIKQLERVNKFLLDETKHAFHNRFTIIPRAAYMDEETGFSSTDTVLEIYANKSKTSNTFTIEANRMSDVYTTTR